jgi:hypothetical protein
MRGMGVHDMVVHDVEMNDIGVHNVAVQYVAMHDMVAPVIGVLGVDVHERELFSAVKN